MSTPTVYYTDGDKSKLTTGMIHGGAGSGKTPFASTAPNVLVVTTEPGLKSLRQYHIPYVAGRDFAETKNVYEWLKGSQEPKKKYQTIYLDGISALSESIIEEEKRKSNDPRKFSPNTMARTMDLVKLYLTLVESGYHVWMTCKSMNTPSPDGVPFFEPFAVVPKLGPVLPYHFDDVLYISRYKATDGNWYGQLTCMSDAVAYARNRTGLLAQYEPANLTHIINKTNGAM